MDFKKKQKKYNEYIDIINKEDFSDLNESVQLSIYKQALKSADSFINVLVKKCKVLKK